MKHVPWAEVRRLLVTRTDHLGDLVVSTPGLKALRSALNISVAMVAPSSAPTIRMFAVQPGSPISRPRSIARSETRSARAWATSR